MADPFDISSHKDSWLKAFLDKTELKLALKTGVASSLSLFLGLAFSTVFQRPDTLVSGLWCVLSAIVVLQAQLGGTYKAAWVRFLGVAIGSITGSLFFVYLKSDSPASLGISIFVTIVTCSLLNLKESFRIASLSTAIIIVLGGIHPELNPWVFSLFRFLDSCIGILSAVFVAHVLWPERASQHLQFNMVKIVRLVGKQYRLVTDLRLESSTPNKVQRTSFTDIQELLYENRGYIEESKLELLTRPPRPEDWALIARDLETIFESVAALSYVSMDVLTKIFDDTLLEQVNLVIAKTDLCFSELAKMIEIQKPPVHLAELEQTLNQLNIELIRFRSTRTTNKFNIDDVENFFMFFYRLRAIGIGVKKMEESVQKILKIT